jgi:hypothetical protein
VFSSFAIQPDSKIITAYKQDHYNSFGQVDSSYFIAERYNQDGTLDNTLAQTALLLPILALVTMPLLQLLYNQMEKLLLQEIVITINLRSPDTLQMGI